MKEGNPFSNLPLIPTGKEIFNMALRKSKRMQVKKGKYFSDGKNVRPSLIYAKVLLRTKITRIEYCIDKEINKIIRGFPDLESIHPFYKEMIEVISGMDNIKKALGHLKIVLELVKKLTKKYIYKVSAVKKRQQIIKLKRQYIARVASMISTIEPSLNIIREFRNKAVSLPSIDSEVFTLVIVGPPNTGKSSFVKSITRAKVKVSSYPFTTRDIMVGHCNVNGIRVQIIDTPGLLDRPIEEKNEIELKAIASLKYLANVIIFLFDPSETCGYPINIQLRVYKELTKLIPSKLIIPVINKADISLEEKKNYVKFKLERNVPEIVAITGLGVSNIIAIALRESGRYIQSRKQV